MKKNLLVAQSGGPTAVINGSLSGLIREAMCHPEVIGAVYGAVNGIEGILQDRIIRVDDQFASAADFELLCHTPSSALGSCRFKMPSPESGAAEYARLLEIFRKYEIGFFAYIGGNDSMDTANKIANYCYEHGEEVRVVGVPKTIDNDLPVTDHCPGFGSAAKYIATTLMEISADSAVYPLKSVTVVEIMGRNAGWLTAASSLSRALGGSYGPQLIYLPEAAFDVDCFLDDVRGALEKEDSVVIAVSEGVRLGGRQLCGGEHAVGTGGRLRPQVSGRCGQIPGTAHRRPYWLQGALHRTERVAAGSLSSAVGHRSGRGNPHR